MKTSYTAEFTNLTKHSTELSDVTIINNTCYAKLKPYCVVKIELCDTYTRGDYNAFRISIINKNGIIDKLDIIIADLLVSKSYDYQYYFNYNKEHILFTNTNEHFITTKDYKAIAEKIDSYLKLFSGSFEESDGLIPEPDVSF